ncbi:MAG: PaaI family thioesterase [Ideonella sp.]|nr:PaaI family thioesterase [Ideonella sp.]
MHPFADLIDLKVQSQSAGCSTLSLAVADCHLNPHGVVHGAVIFAMADTGMGAALYPTLADGEICATIEIKINFFKPVVAGLLRCQTELVNRGRTVANLESRVFADDRLVAQANGNYAIFKPGKSAA